jgi:hypothetical protein
MQATFQSRSVQQQQGALDGGKQGQISAAKELHPDNGQGAMKTFRTTPHLLHGVTPCKLAYCNFNA